MPKQNTFTDRFVSFFRLFHTGPETAIKAAELAFVFRLEAKTVQAVIHRLRLEGVPICGDRGGYYYASCDSDIRRTAQWLMTVGSRIQNTACAMLCAAELDNGAADALDSMERTIDLI